MDPPPPLDPCDTYLDRTERLDWIYLPYPPLPLFTPTRLFLSLLDTLSFPHRRVSSHRDFLLEGVLAGL